MVFNLSLTTESVDISNCSHQDNGSGSRPSLGCVSELGSGLGSSHEHHEHGSTGGNSNCSYGPTEFVTERFVLIVLFMGSMCFFGLIGNAFSVYVLSRPKMQTMNNWFLVLLAAFDMGVLLSSFGIYVLEIAYEFTNNFTLYKIWYLYVREMFLLSHVCQAGAVYATVLATLERWLSLHLQSIHCLCDRKTALYSSGVLLVFAVLFALPKYFEFYTIANPECISFGRYTLVPSWLLRNEVYAAVYSVWISSLFFLFVPFFVLLVLNLSLVYKITRRVRDTKVTVLTPWIKRFQRRLDRRKTKQATFVLMIVVFVFLICNLPALLLTFLEQIAPTFLQHHSIIYSFWRDLVNIMAVISSSANFVVYLVFGRDFRKEIAKIPKLLRKRFCFATRHKRNFALYKRWRNMKRKRKETAEPLDLLMPCRDESERRNAHLFAVKELTVFAKANVKHGPRIFEALP